MVAGTYSVTVSGGTSTVSSVTIAQPSAISINIPTPNVLNCTTTSVEISASATGGSSTNFSYKWSNGAVTPSTNINTAGTYTVTATNGVGCTTSQSIVVQSNTQKPSIAIGTPSIICAGQSIPLNASGSSVGANFTYKWSGAGITAGATTLNPTVNVAGNYSLSVTNTSNNCVSTSSVMVNQGAVPTINMVAGKIKCLPNTTTIKAINDPLTNNYSFNWSGVNNFNSQMAIPTVSKTGNYYVTVTKNGACSKKDSIAVSADTIKPNISASGGEITCTKKTVLLQGNSINNVTYQWTNQGGFNATVKDTAVSAIGTYTLKVTNPTNGCTSEKNVEVKVNDSIPNIAATASGNITCLIKNIILNGNSSATGTYQWTGPNNFLSNKKDTSTVVSGSYTLLVTDSKSGCSVQKSVQVADNSNAPTLEVETSMLDCSHKTVDIKANSNASELAYQWSGPNNFSSNKKDTPTTIPGTYTVTITNVATGCSNTKSVTVIQNIEKPQLTVSSQNSTAISGNGSATANVQGGMSPFIYQWKDSTGKIVGNTPTLTNLSAGTYKCEMTGANGCSNEIEVIIKSVVATKDEVFANSIKLYPNPTNDELFIDIENENTFYFTLFDMKGRIVIATSLLQNKQAIQLPNLNAGIYFAKIKIGDKIINKKVRIQN